MSCMKPEPALAAELLTHAQHLQCLGDLVAEQNPRLAGHLRRIAMRAALYANRAERIERELATAQRTVREIALDAAEEADAAEGRACPTATIIAAMATRQRYARTIAEILAPVLRHPGQH
jgi:hypothetical protein